MTISVRYSIAGRTASAIGASLEAGLRDGRFGPGASLPTVRELARSLRVSPATVASAYRALRLRGLLVAHGRRGTRVAPRPPLSLPRPELALLPGLRNVAEGNPDPSLLPALAPALRAVSGRPRLYGQPPHRLTELAARAFAADGIPSGAVCVVAGSMDGVERVLQTHLRPGDRVAVEDPGYSAVFDLVGALGLVPEPVSMNDDGPLPQDLARALRAGAQAFIVTPRAQNPTGAALTGPRTRELRAVLAAHPGVLVVEDDHAGPVAGAPPFTLCDAHRPRWAVVRSVSKSLGPDLRLALIAGDATTVARVEGRQALGSGWVSHVLQDVVASLWEDHTTVKGLRQAAVAYGERRQALLRALGGYGISAHGRSGFNVWIPVREEAGVVAGLAAAGWGVRAGERYRLKSPPAVRVTTAALKPKDGERLARALHRMLEGEPPARTA